MWVHFVVSRGQTSPYQESELCHDYCYDDTIRGDGADIVLAELGRVEHGVFA